MSDWETMMDTDQKEIKIEKAGEHHDEKYDVAKPQPKPVIDQCRAAQIGK